MYRVSAFPIPPSAKPLLTRRTPVTVADIQRAVHAAREECGASQSVQTCRAAWDLVEELSAEMDRQLEENVRRMFR